MGAACSSDKYKQLKQKYGLQLAKLIVVQKGKVFLDRIINKLKKQITQAALKQSTIALSFVDQKQAIIDKYYLKVVEQFDKRQLGGLKCYGQLFENTIQDQLGYTFIKQGLHTLRQNIKEQFDQQEITMVDEVTKIKNQEQKGFIQQSCNEKLNSDIVQDQKEFVFKKGEMQFHDVIAQYQEYLLSNYGNRLKIQYYSSRLKSIQYQQLLQNMVMISKDKLITRLNLTLSQKIHDYILISQDQPTKSPNQASNALSQS